MSTDTDNSTDLHDVSVYTQPRGGSFDKTKQQYIDESSGTAFADAQEAAMDPDNNNMAPWRPCCI